MQDSRRINTIDIETKFTITGAIHVAFGSFGARKDSDQADLVPVKISTVFAAQNIFEGSIRQSRRRHANYISLCRVHQSKKNTFFKVNIGLF